jgi:hypothetical protein
MSATVYELWDYAHTEEQSKTIADFFETISDKIVSTEFTEFNGTKRMFIDAESAQQYVDFVNSLTPAPAKLSIE